MFDEKLKYKERYKVITVSTNTNSFGLYQFVLVSKAGKAFKAHASFLNCPKKDTFIDAPLAISTAKIVKPDFTRLGFELIEEQPNVPKNVLKEIFA